MKPKPLHNKMWCLKHPDRSRYNNCRWVAKEEDIKSAIDWLKKEMDKSEEGLDVDRIVWIKDKIDEAFPDIYNRGTKRGIK